MNLSFEILKQVKVKAMQAHQDRIDRMRMFGEQIVRQYDAAQVIRSDLDDFTRKWQAAYSKLGKKTLSHFFSFIMIAGMLLMQCYNSSAIRSTIFHHQCLISKKNLFTWYGLALYSLVSWIHFHSSPFCPV